jgi:hypothetical protein
MAGTACFTPSGPGHTNENGLQCRPFEFHVSLRAVALLEFLVTATWARIVAANVLQGVTHRFLMGMAAVRTVDMAVLVVVVGVAMIVVIVVAIGAMHMGLLVHRVTPE